MKLPSRKGMQVSVDTEGSGLFVDDGARVSTVSVAWDGGSFAIPFGQGPEGTLFDGKQDAGRQEWDRLINWLGEQRLVFANAKHDILQLNAGSVGGHPGQWLAEQMAWDCMLAEWVLEPLETHDLGDMGMRYLGIPKADSELKKHLKTTRPRNRYDLVPWSAMETYARVDAEITWGVAQAQWSRLEREEHYLETVVQEQMDLCRVFAGMERRGVGYDAQGSLAEAKKAKTLADQIKRGLPLTPTPEGARKWFYGIQGALPHCVTPKKGTPSVAECCVRQLVAEGVPGAREWQQLQKVTHASSMWYEGWAEKVGPDGRLRPGFKQMGTISFRRSATRVQLHAIPHDYRMVLVEGCKPVRSLFEAAPGKVLYEMDLAQAELRVATRYAKCKLMREFIESGADAHGETVKRLFDISESNERWFEFRQVAKRCNFALIYSVGVDTFVADVEKHTGIKLSKSRGREIIDAWRGLYPEFPRVNRKAETLARRRGFVKLANGRLRWFKPYEEMHKAFNAIVQGGIAVFTGQWMIEIDQRWPETLVLEVHDSVVVEPEIAQAKIVVPDMADLGAKMATDLFGIKMETEYKPWHKELVDA